MPASRVRIAHTLDGCETLGPGRRFVVWVAGCNRGCPGCIAGPILGPEAGRWNDIGALADRIASARGIDGVTFSAVEPFEQAAALAVLCDRVRATRDLSVMAYSGHLLAGLEASRDAGTQALLRHLDILVDGPFIAPLQGDHLWRGSSNQRIHLLTPRHADLVDALHGAGSGVEIHVSRARRVFWAGVPTPGFVAALEHRLRDRGICLDEVDGCWT